MGQCENKSRKPISFMMRMSKKKNPGLDPSHTKSAILPCLCVHAAGPFPPTRAVCVGRRSQTLSLIPFTLFATGAAGQAGVCVERSKRGEDMINMTMRARRHCLKEDCGRRLGANFPNRISLLSGCWLPWPLMVRGSFPYSTMLILERRQSSKTHVPWGMLQEYRGPFHKPARLHLCF